MNNIEVLPQDIAHQEGMHDTVVSNGKHIK